MRIQMILFLCIFLCGCSINSSSEYTRSYIKMYPDTRLYSFSKSYSIKAPVNRGVLFEGFDKTDDFTLLRRRIMGEIVEFIYFEIEKINTFDGEKYLDLENLKSFELNIDQPNIKYENKTFGRYYDKAFISIIDGVKCRNFPRKLNQKWNYQNKGDGIIQTQEYETYCSFYSSSGEPKVLRIRSEYSYNLASDIFKKNSNLTEKEILNGIIRQFRQDMEEIFSNVEINMDRQKMRQNGLLFETNSKEIKWK